MENALADAMFDDCYIFFISPFIAFLQGLGKVKEIALMQFIQQCVSVIGLIGTLLLGGKLYAGGIALFLGVLVCTCFVYKRFSKILYAIYRNSVTCVISYKKEIFPFQWKIALSWISSYFIFNYLIQSYLLLRVL